MKKVFGPKFGSKGPKSGPKLFFFHFLKLGLLVFLEITYNDSLEQYVTSSTVKTKNIETRFGPKSGPKLRGFLPFSQVWFISLPLSYIG